jgi:outer membrane protein assembly factor BamB
VDLSTGKLAWKTRHKNEPSVVNLTVADGRVYGGSYPDPEGGASAHGRYKTPGYLFALDAKTGNVAWSKTLGNVERADGKPVCGNGTVYFMVAMKKDSRLEALEAGTGKTLWTLEVPGHLSGLALSGDLLVIASGMDTVRGVDVKARKEVWSFKGEKGVSEIFNPVIVRDVVYVPTGGRVGGVDHKTGRTSPIYGVDLKTGKQLWRCQIPGTDCLDQDGNRTSWNSYAPGWACPDDSKRVYMFSFTGKFYCFEEPK